MAGSLKSPTQESHPITHHFLPLDSFATFQDLDNPQIASAAAVH